MAPKNAIDISRSPHFDNIFMKNSSAFVCPVEPPNMNERLTIQQGVFLCPGNIDVPFEENIAVNLESGLQMHKVVLRNKLRVQALVDLLGMNISRATLFPGIDGFAQSLKQMLLVEHPSRCAR